MVVLIAFVYFAQPIQAKADQPTLDYQTTTASLSEVKAMITGMEAAIIPIVFIVIGFLALTYCTLRNVNVPITYSSDTSFIDKCSELGHYCFDNATEALKPVLYSVYEFIASGQVVDPTRISSTLPFLISSVAQFFSAFSAWIGTSLINNVSDIGEGLLSAFTVNELPFLNSYDYLAYFLAVYSQYCSIPFSQTLGYFTYINIKHTSYYFGYNLLDISAIDAVVFHMVSSNDLEIGFYATDRSGNFLVKNNVSYKIIEFNYTSNYSGPNARPDKSTYNDAVITSGSGNQLRFNLGNGERVYYPANFIPYLMSLGLTVYFGSSIANTLSISDVSIYQDVLTPWADQVYTPTDDVIDADIDDIADKLGEGATIGSLAALIALLTQDKALTLGTAITDVQTINSAGDYNFPSMDNIWKYPQYFFDMLHGWGTFVKGCLNAVTVGEGGLSWLFYGGFVLLICGGIIGKILLG